MSEKVPPVPPSAPAAANPIQPLLGRADHRLDPKRRFTIPSDWFERMGRPGQVYVMPSLSHLSGTARCLDLFCPSEFDRRMEAFRTAALSDSSRARFTSRIGELVSCVAVDTMNRVRVKDSLLSFAGISGDIVLIGAGFHVELWSLPNRPKLDGSEGDVLSALAAEAQAMGF
jgi:MraZ protein